jgi:hypothetical protein
MAGYTRGSHTVHDIKYHIVEELFRDNVFRQLVRRAEGGLLVVPEKNRKKFYSLLNTHGIGIFDNR